MLAETESRGGYLGNALPIRRSTAAGQFGAPHARQRGGAWAAPVPWASGRRASPSSLPSPSPDVPARAVPSGHNAGGNGVRVPTLNEVRGSAQIPPPLPGTERWGGRLWGWKWVCIHCNGADKNERR